MLSCIDLSSWALTDSIDLLITVNLATLNNVDKAVIRRVPRRFTFLECHSELYEKATKMAVKAEVCDLLRMNACNEGGGTSISATQ